MLSDRFSVRTYCHKKIFDLFHRLRLMRNTAVHARQQQQVTPAEAIEYRDLALVLVGKFRDAFEAYVAKHKTP